MELTKTKFKQSEVGMIPEDWSIVYLRDLINVLTDFTANGSFSSLAQNVQYLNKPSYARIVRLTDIRVKFNNEGIYVDKAAYDFLAKSKLFGNELLLANVGAYTGYSFLYPNNLPFKASLGPNMFLLKFDSSKIDSIYSFIIFNSPLLMNQLLNKAASSAQPKLNKQNVRECLIPLPPTLSEQKAIATALSDVDELIAKLEKLIEKKKAIKQGAMQALLTPPHKGGKRLEGFSGEWVEKNLGELAEMASGGTPSSKVSDYYKGNIIWVSISDISNSGKYINDSSKKITEAGLLNSSARLFQENTLLFAMYASIGKCCIAKTALTTSQAILGISVKENLDLEFLYYYLSYNQGYLANQGQQGTQANLSKRIVQSIRITIPKAEEQRAIAKVLSDIDSDITKLELRTNKFVAMKQGMMQELLTGRTRLV